MLYVCPNHRGFHLVDTPICYWLLWNSNKLYNRLSRVRANDVIDIDFQQSQSSLFNIVVWAVLLAGKATLLRNCLKTAFWVGKELQTSSLLNMLSVWSNASSCMVLINSAISESYPTFVASQVLQAGHKYINNTTAQGGCENYREKRKQSARCLHVQPVDRKVCTQERRQEENQKEWKV